METDLPARLIRRLIDAAYKINGSLETAAKFKHLTFICRGNKIVAWGFNQHLKTHPLANREQFDYKYPYIHSELDALRKIPGPPYALARCRIINFRIGNKNQLLLSRPCLACQKLISAFGLAECWYSNKGDKIDRLGR